MRIYDKLYADEIVAVSIGRQVLPVVAKDGAEQPAKMSSTEAVRKQHQDRLDVIANDDNMTAKQKRDAVDQENRDYATHTPPDEFPAAEVSSTEDGPELVHLTTAGGAKRAILRSELQLAATLKDGPRAGHPNMPRPVPGLLGQTPRNPAPVVVPPVDAPEVAADDLYPQVGDFLVEDFDLATDKLMQKIYDAATFHRYFKASVY